MFEEYLKAVEERAELRAIKKFSKEVQLLCGHLHHIGRTRSVIQTTWRAKKNLPSAFEENMLEMFNKPCELMDEKFPHKAPYVWKVAVVRDVCGERRVLRYLVRGADEYERGKFWGRRKIMHEEALDRDRRRLELKKHRPIIKDLL